MKEKIIKRLLYGFNVVYAVFGLAIAIVGLWFYVVQTKFVTLRNVNHYMLDYRVYWPQIVPWLFFILGIFALILGFCGLYGANRRSKIWIKAYCLLLTFLIIGQVITAILIFVFVDGYYTDVFIKDTIYDGFSHTASDNSMATAFNYVEKEFKCCGANDARDYRSLRNDLPISCCEDFVDRCEFTDKEANERLGCAEVIAFHTKLVSSIVAGVSLVICIVEMIDIYFAWKLLQAFRKERR